jgi:RNA polymerase sigma-70 factor (ECF subfamily)
MAEETDDALMARYGRQGDPAAYATLVDRYSDRLFAFFLRSVDDREAARDLVQSTFLHVHRARADFRPGEPFRPWVYTIATNLRREHFRRRRRKPEALWDPERHPEPAVGPAASTASDRAVRRALAGLSDDQREVVELHWFSGFSFPEIGELVGASTTAVKVRAHRAYARLRTALGE